MLSKQDFHRMNIYLVALLGFDRLRKGDYRIRLQSFEVVFLLIRKELIKTQESLSPETHPHEKRILLWLEDMLALMEYGLMTNRMIREYVDACESVQSWIHAKIPLTLDYIVDLRASLIEAGFDFDFDKEYPIHDTINEVSHVSA